VTEAAGANGRLNRDTAIPHPQNVAATFDSVATAEGSSDLGPDLGWGLLIATRAYGRLAEQAVADLPGGPRGYLVLMTAARGRPRSQLALARELGLDKTVMTHLLDELEQAGLTQRQPDPSDRRVRQILITGAGKKQLLSSHQRMTNTEHAFLAALSVAEAVAFRAFVERVARASQSSAAGPCSNEPCVGESSLPC
jgi:DNA-binding MarR family transcriptional regulator